MLELSAPSPGLLFFSFLYRSDLFDSVFSMKLEALYGPCFSFVPGTNPLVPFYAKEMGQEKDLRRVFYVSHKIFPREYLLSTKLVALDWEREWSQEGKRMVNVDSGLLTAENFLLATTKNYSHRVYLGQNIFADLTYQFVHGQFQVLPWTYPDYQDQEKLDFLSWCRSYLLLQSAGLSI